METVIVKALGKTLWHLDPAGSRALDRLFVQDADDVLPPAIFVIGGPRVGSTLTYQLLASALNVDFVSNVEYALYHTPALAMAAKRKLSGPFCSSFESDYGYERGLWSPSEAERWWQHWFDHRTQEKELCPRADRLSHITRCLAGAHRQTGRVFLAGQNSHTQYTDQLRAQWPNALFVHITRDPIRAAASVLRVRQSLYGDLDSWFSVRPFECQHEYKTPFDAVIAQQCTINRRVAEFSEGDNANITVDYDALCAHPGQLVEQVAAQMSISPHFEAVPANFSASQRPLTDEWSTELGASLDRWHAKESS